MYFNRIFRFWTIHFGDPPFTKPPWSCPRIYLGWLSLPLWKMMDFVSWDDDIPNWMEKNKSIVPNHQPVSEYLFLYLYLYLPTPKKIDHFLLRQSFFHVSPLPASVWAVPPGRRGRCRTGGWGSFHLRPIAMGRCWDILQTIGVFIGYNWYN